MKPILGSLLLTAALLTSANASPDLARLEELLNGARMGAHTTARHQQRFAEIRPDTPVGQTFVVSEHATHVFRVAIWQAFWHESWQPDEKLVMTLWDSPQKRLSYGRYTIPYSRRMWEGAVPMFTLEAKLPPSRTYYLELTVEVERVRPAVSTAAERLEGEQLPPIASGDGVLMGIGTAEDDYPHGTAIVGGEPQPYDLWFEVHEIHRVSRETLFVEAFRHFNLDYPPLQPLREAVERKDWETAIRLMVAHFESRPDLVSPSTPADNANPEFDTREADLACEGKVLVTPDGLIADLGPEWNHYTLWPERGGVGLTRAGLRKPLAGAYASTGNGKYARAFSEMLYHFFRQCPSPLKAGVWKREQKIPGALPPGLAGGSIWSGLSIGARMGHGFAYYSRFMHSPWFPLWLRAAFIFNLAEMAEVLERMEAGGNWEAQIATTLYEFGLAYPEFAGAKRWIEQGVQVTIENARGSVFRDGVLREPTTGYHLLVMARYRNLIKRAGELGITVPEDIRALTERMHEYVMYSTLPDGTLPIWGDGNPPMRPDVLREAADIFRREDFRFIGSAGAEGRPPQRTSVGFPDGGFYYMRNSWRPDSHYMGIRCGPFGSHGHYDALSIIVAPFGRTLLIDPGVYIYGTTEAAELSHTRSHNTVTVDGARTARNGIPDLWVTAEVFDFFAGHNDGFQGVPDARHHRRIWFLKPRRGFEGFWLIVDDVLGSGEREARAHFRFHRVNMQADGFVRTAEDDANLMIQEVASVPARLQLSKGIAVVDESGLTQVPTADFVRRGSLPLSFTFLMTPFRQKTPPAVRSVALRLEPSAPDARAVWIEQAQRGWLIVLDGVSSLHAEPQLRKTTLPDGTTVSVRGAGNIIEFARERNRWRAVRLMGVRLQEATLGGKTLFRMEKPEESVETLVR